ncbi:ATP-dependent Clp protease adapter ClpS [Leucobacter viscericola]|uniref:ATP-dependent Clp protease adapter protein ClpS n=1 Tax=Leucobacter viscericola TaxID=2714935 RepID=A0A6G7XCW0_9MICO|nr:ATP-dependent Clp protease adapter ClpS [Leucobacter viscericola]QIK62208.1 ATP-dependent Clp protease adapter ClpS [Leucobacter viscericola]
MLATKVQPDATRVESKQPSLEPTWQTVVWDDPVNLMSYVSYVFQTHFGFDADHAEQLMLQVHHRGKAVVAEGSRETMEMHVEAMHSYGLWATVQQAGGS